MCLQLRCPHLAAEHRTCDSEFAGVEAGLVDLGLARLEEAAGGGLLQDVPEQDGAHEAPGAALEQVEVEEGGLAGAEEEVGLAAAGSAGEELEAAAEVAAVVAEALVAVEVVEAAECGQKLGLGGDPDAGLLAGNGKIAHGEGETIAVEVATAEFVAVRGRRAEADGGVGELGQARTSRERHGDPLFGDGVLVLEAGEADLRAGDAGLAAELDDRVFCADAPLAQGEQEVGAGAAVRAVGGDLVDGEVLRAHAGAAADAREVGRLQRGVEQAGLEFGVHAVTGCRTTGSSAACPGPWGSCRARP